MAWDAPANPQLVEGAAFGAGGSHLLVVFAAPPVRTLANVSHAEITPRKAQVFTWKDGRYVPDRSAFQVLLRDTFRSVAWGPETMPMLDKKQGPTLPMKAFGARQQLRGSAVVTEIDSLVSKMTSSVCSGRARRVKRMSNLATGHVAVLGNKGVGLEVVDFPQPRKRTASRRSAGR